MEPAGARWYTYKLSWGCSAGLPIALLPRATPSKYWRFLSLFQREREKKRGRVVKTRARLELNTMEGSVLPSQSPFIGMAEGFVTE